MRVKISIFSARIRRVRSLRLGIASGALTVNGDLLVTHLEFSERSYRRNFVQRDDAGIDGPYNPTGLTMRVASRYISSHFPSRFLFLLLNYKATKRINILSVKGSCVPVKHASLVT